MSNKKLEKDCKPKNLFLQYIIFDLYFWKAVDHLNIIVTSFFCEVFVYVLFAVTTFKS